MLRMRPALVPAIVTRSVPVAAESTLRLPVTTTSVPVATGYSHSSAWPLPSFLTVVTRIVPS